MENSFSSNSITVDHVAIKFGTCHDSPAVVPCAKFCSDHFISTWMRAKWNFHHIWIVMEKLLVKWAPVTHLPPNPWWRHIMERFSVVLALCERNPPVTSGFPSKRANNAELWCFLWCGPQPTVEQTVELELKMSSKNVPVCLGHITYEPYLGCHDGTLSSQKQKGSQVDYFEVAGYPWVGRGDHFKGSQWLQSSQHDCLPVSAM